MVIGHCVLAIVMILASPAHARQGVPFDAAQGATRAVIRVKGSATVRGTEIFLRDVAQIQTPDRSLAEQLGALPIGQAPLPGLSRTFDPDLIMIKFRQYKIDTAGIQMESPKSVVILGEHRVVSSGEIFEAAKRSVLKDRDGEFERVTVRADTLPPDLVVPPGEVELKARPRLASVGVGSIPVVVEAWVDGRLYRVVSLSVKLSLFREVVVANHPLPRHAVVRVADVRLERRDISVLSHKPLNDLTLVVGRRTTRMLAYGDVVASDAVELPPLIRKGDVVTLMVESPGLLITAKGVAQEEGRAGQLVRVKNAASGREILGTVESEKTVRVGF
jgi:flagella basal body P-ring formation protein FlgA